MRENIDKLIKLIFCIGVILCCSSCVSVNVQEEIEKKVANIMQSDAYEVLLYQVKDNVILVETLEDHKRQLHIFYTVNDRGINYNASYRIEEGVVYFVNFYLQDKAAIIVFGKDKDGMLASYQITNKSIENEQNSLIITNSFSNNQELIDIHFISDNSYIDCSYKDAEKNEKMCEIPSHYIGRD